MERSVKEQQVSELRELLLDAQAVILTDYKGMTVDQMYRLRRKFDAVGVGYRVVKNTLAKLAVAGTGYEFLAAGFEGPVAVAVSKDDPVAPAKVLAEFQKEAQHLQVKLGYLDGKRIEGHQVEALSKLGSKDELRAKLLSVFNAPASKFVMVLNAIPQNVLGVLTARKNALEEA